jgi:4-azaleucine resistance transporter AzlC
MISSPKSEFLTGIRNTFPLLIGAFPFGLIFGALAVNAGISKIATISMSLFVFAGSSQFIAVGLYSASAPIAIIVLTTFIVNLRHILYSLTLLPQIKRLPNKWKVLLAFWLTDETFTVSVIRYRQSDGSPYKHWYQLGSSIAMYLNWQIWTIVGVELGDRIPDAAGWGLDVAMPIAFIGMLIPLVRTSPVIVCVLTAGVVSLLTAKFPLNSGLLISVLFGILFGLFTEKRIERKSEVLIDVDH